MHITIQASNIQQLDQALQSSSQTIRFGSEFCMYALPAVDNLENAYNKTQDADKDFVYVTPRLADGALDKIRKQLMILNELGGCQIVANDLGTINVLNKLTSLKPYLGRQLVYTPSRCPWNQITEHTVSFFTMRRVKQIFYQTALNYEPSIQFFKNLGIEGADVDWIPEIFRNLSFLSKNNLQVSVHLNSIPVAITRKCHMARFLGIENLENCPRPCYTNAYKMNNEFLKTELFLHGNVVSEITNPDTKMARQLNKQGVKDIVITMGPLTKINSHENLDNIIQSISANY